MVTCVVEDVAIFRHLSLRTAVFSPGRTKSSHSALHTRLCESKGRLLRTYLARDTLIWTICLFELSGGNKQKEDLIPLSFSVLGDCMLSHILRMWASRDPATLNIFCSFVFPFVPLRLQSEKLRRFFPLIRLREKSLRLLLSGQLFSPIIVLPSRLWCQDWRTQNPNLSGTHSRKVSWHLPTCE